MSLSDEMMTVGVCKNVADALRKEGCKGCVHDKIGCGRRDKGEYCGTIEHDGADVIYHLCAEIEKRDAEKWTSVDDGLPKEFVSVLAHMTDAGEFPSVREAYVVCGRFFFPALKENHPVDRWMKMPK